MTAIVFVGHACRHSETKPQMLTTVNLPHTQLASSSTQPQLTCNALPVLSTATRLRPGLRSGAGWYAGGAMRLAMTLWMDGDGHVK